MANVTIIGVTNVLPPDKLKRIEEKVEQLELLSQLSQILNSTLDHKEIRRRAMEAATQLMKAEVGSLLLVNEEKRHLYFEVALGAREEDIKTISLNFGEGIAGWVAQHGKSLIVNSPEQDRRFFKGVDERTEFKTIEILSVSLLGSKKRPLGFYRPLIRREKENLTRKTFPFSLH